MKAVLFDLDDTLFDHKYSRLKALAALQAKFPQLTTASLVELEREHEKLLSVDYVDVLDGKISIADGVTRRIAKLFSKYGAVKVEDAKAAANLYNHVYALNRQAVPGAMQLLTTLKKHAKLGVVTNGLVEAQNEKLRLCQIEGFMDFMVVSEAVGFKKPSREIFELALKQAGVDASEAVFVGDSWVSDVLPAVSVGMRAVWLNRYGLKCPDSRVAIEVNSFEGVKEDLFL